MKHHHDCPRCGSEMECHAPIVVDWDSDDRERVCILVLENDLSMCEDCESDSREQGDDDSELDGLNEGADL